MNRQRIINLAAAISAVTVFGFTLGLMFPLLALIMEKQGISPNVIGLNAAMQPLGIVLSLFFIPFAVRVFGTKRTVIGSAVITAVVITAYPYAPIFWAWFGLRVLHGFFVSTLFAISEAWIVKFSEGPWRSRLLALYTSVLALSFGGGPSLISITGIEGALPFLIGALVLVSASIPILFVHDEEVDEASESPTSVLGFVRKAPLLILSVAAFAIVDAAFLSFLAVYGVKKGMAQDVAALSLTVFIVGNTALQFPIGWLADHANKKGVIAGCAGVTGLSIGLMPLTFGTPFYWALLVLGGAGSAGMYTVALSALGDDFSGDDLTTGTACFSTTWGAGALVGALGTGGLFETFGPNGMPYGMAVVTLAFCAMMVAGLRRGRPRPIEQA
jgi:MFS family permease